MDWAIRRAKQLQERLLEEKLLRRLQEPKHAKDFLSNDYLGFARNQAYIETIKEEISKLPSVGATGSRLLSGNSTIMEETEAALAQFYGGEKALLFANGYLANLAVVSTLPHRHDSIYYDEQVHASIKDALRLSMAKKIALPHNAVSRWETNIEEKAEGNWLIVEGLYSMSGNWLPWESIKNLSKANQLGLLIDEAHSTGITGENGRGVSYKGEDHYIRIHTFGKAFGLQGACVVGPSPLIDQLINQARPFIYTTGLFLPLVVAIKTALPFIEKADLERKQLQDNIRYAKEALATSSNSPIHYIEVGSNEGALALSEHLQSQDFNVLPIRSPTVPKGKEGVRVVIHSFTSKEEIRTLGQAIAQFF